MAQGSVAHDRLQALAPIACTPSGLSKGLSWQVGATLFGLRIIARGDQ
jgi:hypothetical protein